MSPKEGNPHIIVRIDREVLEQLRQKAEVRWPRSTGRGGGVAHYLRCLAYNDLGLPEPEPWAAKVSTRKRKKPAE